MMEQQAQISNQKQCGMRREVSASDKVATADENKLLQQLPWPTKRSCIRHLNDSDGPDDRSGTIRAVRGYCQSRNLPSDVYRPVAGQCGGGQGKFRLNDLIGELHRVFAEDRVNVEYVQYLMESYQSDPAEWLKYAKFNKFRYTRNLVDSGNGKFNLMVLCWGEGNSSSIHDHPNSDCIMKILAGQLTEVRFAWPSAPDKLEDHDGENDEDLRPMYETGRTLLETDSVCHINGQ